MGNAIRPVVSGSVSFFPAPQLHTPQVPGFASLEPKFSSLNFVDVFVFFPLANLGIRLKRALPFRGVRVGEITVGVQVCAADEKKHPPQGHPFLHLSQP